MDEVSELVSGQEKLWHVHGLKGERRKDEDVKEKRKLEVHGPSGTGGHETIVHMGWKEGGITAGLVG